MAMAMRFARVSRAAGSRVIPSARIVSPSKLASNVGSGLGSSVKRNAPRALVSVVSSQCVTTQRVCTVTPLNLSGPLQLLVGNYDDGR